MTALVLGAAAVAAVAQNAGVPGPTELISQLRPRVEPFSAAEIDRVAAASGLTDCFWVATVSAKTFNILSPDEGVTAWIAQYRLPPGARLALEGRYAHARHVSLNSYDGTGQPVDRLHGLLIAPAAGSTNPFLAGAARRAPARDWRAEIVPRAHVAGQPIVDAERAVNTLYVPDDAAPVQLWYRVYVPDQETDAKGGVTLPQPVLTLADGRLLRGDALCREIVLKEGAVRDVRIPAASLKAMFALPSLSPAPPAQREPEWAAFFNPPIAAAQLLAATPWATLRDRIDPTRRGDVYSSPDEAAMSMYIDARLGDLLVLGGRAPRTPRTRAGNPVMETGDLRYWSLCQYRSLADTAVDACVHDEQVTQDAEGRITIVISRPDKRPANARAECGVTWLAWGSGDGIGNPDGGFLALRQLLPSPEFRSSSLFATRRPGDEHSTLGAYYLEARYTRRADFERRGCPG